MSIPDLLDPEDVVGYEHPDHLSIMTYVSQFYHAFARRTAFKGERRARSVGRYQNGAMQRLFEESRRTRSVSRHRGSTIPEEETVSVSTIPDSENPFKNIEDDDPVTFQETKNVPTLPRRSKKRSNESKIRVRSLFIDNLDRAPIKDIPADIKPRHVLSHSSYARPYNSSLSLASTSHSDNLDTITNELKHKSLELNGKRKKSSLKKGTEKLANFVKSSVEKLQKKDSANFESQMQTVPSRPSTEHSIA